MMPCPPKSDARRSERGYILITLILFVALVAIAAVVMAPEFVHQMKRDREQELIHRGVQYSRAMKHFVKKFGRYPTRIEELENTNQIRFLRRRYKDPITGKDFRILHMGDVQMSFGGGIAGATPVAGMAPGAPGIGGPGGPGGPGGIGGPGVQNALNTMNSVAMAGGLAAGGINGGAGVGGPGGATSPGATFSTGSNSDENSGEAGGTTPNQGPGLAAAGPGPPGAFGVPGQGTNGPNGQTFGGGPIVGVASTSKDKTIRVFNKKEHYNEWQFIYDPTSDTGGILTTPNQPSLQAGGVGQTGIPGAAPAAGGPGGFSGPGAPGGFPGQPGTGLQPGLPSQPGPQTPQMPPDQ